MVAGSARQCTRCRQARVRRPLPSENLYLQSESSNSKSGSEIALSPPRRASIKGRCSRVRPTRLLIRTEFGKEVLAASTSSRAIAESPYKASNTPDRVRRVGDQPQILLYDAMSERNRRTGRPGRQHKRPFAQQRERGVHRSTECRFAMSDSQGWPPAPTTRSMVLAMACIAPNTWRVWLALLQTLIRRDDVVPMIVSTRLPSSSHNTQEVSSTGDHSTKRPTAPGETASPSAD